MKPGEKSLLAMFCLGVVLSLQGCAVYRPMPLDRAAVNARLAPPDFGTIRIRARDIRHPILKPYDFDMTHGLSPESASIIAVLANPELAGIRDQKKIVEAQLLQAGILPNPQFSYALDAPTGGATQGTVNAFNFGLSWEVTALISRAANVAAAKSEATSVDLDVAWQEWQTAEAAKLQVYHLYFFDRQLAIARQEESELGKNLDRLHEALERGLASIIEVAGAEAAAQRIHAAVITTEQQREDERLALNELLGLPPAQTVPLIHNIRVPRPEGWPAAAELTDGLENRRLDLLALKAGYASQEQKLRAAVLSQFPKINIGFAHAGDTTNVITTGFGVTIDLPLFDHNQGVIAAEQATRAKLFDEYVARLFEARGEIARLVAESRSLQQQIAQADRAIPVLQKVVDSYGAALEQGNADALTYYNARGELMAKRIELFDLQRQLADMDVALEIAAGTYLGAVNKGTSS